MSHSMTISHSKIQCLSWFGLVLLGFNASATAGSYQGGEMIMKSVFWWRKPEYPEEITDLCLSWSDCHGVTKFN